MCYITVRYLLPSPCLRKALSTFLDPQVQNFLHQRLTSTHLGSMSSRALTPLDYSNSRRKSKSSTLGVQTRPWNAPRIGGIMNSRAKRVKQLLVYNRHCCSCPKSTRFWASIILAIPRNIGARDEMIRNTRMRSCHSRTVYVVLRHTAGRPTDAWRAPARSLCM